MVALRKQIKSTGAPWRRPQLKQISPAASGMPSSPPRQLINLASRPSPERRWPTTTSSNGQRHGGAALKNKSTGAPWRRPQLKQICPSRERKATNAAAPPLIISWRNGFHRTTTLPTFRHLQKQNKTTIKIHRNTNPLPPNTNAIQPLDVNA